jgi:hypothetical protein
MKAKDLRIGNLVYFNEELLKFDFESGWNFDFIKPIPLTEEWLLKFGFEKVIYESDETGYGTDYELDIKGVGLISYSDDFSCALFGSKESSKDELGFLPNWDNCKHVHSLQNLYFALTGEELTLNN